MNLGIDLNSIHRHKKFFFLCLWGFISIYTLISHEIWRDEMRALSIVIENEGIWNLFSGLKNEGHPILWYLLLKIGYSVFSYTAILKVISWLVGFGTVVLLFRHSRLPFWIILSYAFSQILLWENTIMSRNYGISSLLILGYLYFYQRVNIIGITVVLILLIQTNALSVFVSWFLFIIALDHSISIKKFNTYHFFISALFLFLSTCLFLFTVLPDNATIVGRGLKNREPVYLILSCIKSFIYPYNVFKTIIGENPIINITLALSLIFCLVYRKILLFSFWTIIAIAQFINIEIYSLYTRHLGILFTFFIILIDIGGVYNKSLEDNLFDKIHQFCKYIVLPSMLIGFNISAIINISKDIKESYSSNKEVSDFIRSKPNYSNSVVIADADFIIEGLPYYLKNRIYLIREQKFGKFVHFTTENKNIVNTKELLDVASKFFKETKCTTLFICNQELRPKNDTLYTYACYTQTKVMKFNDADLGRFKKIKEFKNSLSDENYSLYELR